MKIQLVTDKELERLRNDNRGTMFAPAEECDPLLNYDPNNVNTVRYAGYNCYILAVNDNGDTLEVFAP